MKSSTFPPLRVEPELRRAAEEVLGEGESLSGFMEDAIRASIERRRAQRAFIARGLAARDAARQDGRYVSASRVVGDLEKMLARARAKAGT